MSRLTFELLEFGSPSYQQAIDLRYRVLRKPLGLNYTSEQLAAEANQWHIAALIDNNVGGILIFEKISNEILKMRQVAIDFNLQRSGIGKQLVAYAELFAKKNSFSLIELHARDTAIPFYLSIGYTIVSHTFTEVGIPHKKMSKKI